MKSFDVLCICEHCGRSFDTENCPRCLLFLSDRDLARQRTAITIGEIFFDEMLSRDADRLMEDVE